MQGTESDADGNFYMNGGKISKNECTRATSGSSGAKGGFMYINKGSVIMDDGEISGNSAGREGGCAYVSESDFVMTKGVIKDNYTDPEKGAIGGGAFYVWYGSVTINDGCYIQNNRASTAGGAFYVSFGDFIMNGGVVSGNEAGIKSGTTSGAGGAVYLRGGYFEMHGGIIENNYGTADGGAVDVAASSVDTNVLAEGYTQTDAIKYFVSNTVRAGFEMTGGIIRNNGKMGDTVKTKNGGAVSVTGGSFEMTGGTIIGNYATTNGGAVAIKSHSVRTVRKQLYTQDASGNWVESTESTVESITYYGNFELNYDSENAVECLIQNNVSGNNGGAIYVSLGEVNITGTEETVIISGNRATNDGGAVYIDGGVVKIDDEDVAKGKVTMTGGMISANGLNGATVETKNGGAVYVKNGDFVLNSGTISGNKAVTNGGAVYVEAGNFLMNTGTVTNNHAGEKAGAVYVNGGNFTMNGTVDTSLITANTAAHYGGAVYVAQGDFTMHGGKLDSNKTTTIAMGDSRSGKGGTVYVNKGNFVMHDGQILNSIAGYQGGAVYIGGDGEKGSFVMYNGLISNSRAHSSGGAVYAYEATFRMVNGEISGNYALRDEGEHADFQESGGAVVVHLSTFTMEGGVITNNESYDAGGGVCVIDGSFTMSNGTISANRAPNSNGGGVYVTGGSFTIYGGTITRNTAKLNGGAVYVTGSGAAFTMTSNPDKDATVYDISISYNYAEGNGGAVYLDSGNFTMDRGSLSYNGTDFTVNGQTVSATSTIKTQNGGAVYVNSGNFTMTGGTLEFNRAAVDGGAVYLSSGSFTLSGSNSKTISANYANNNGGAVYVAGSFTMSNGTISGNGKTGSTVKTQNGGAVYVAGGTFSMSGGTLDGNEAVVDGGAVYVNLGDFTMSNGTLKENKAGADGGAVYVLGNPSGTEGKFTLTGGTITCNFAASSGGAVYVEYGLFEMSKANNSVDSILSHNYSNISGGAVYLEGGNFEMEGGTIEYNGRSYSKNGNTVTAGDAVTERGGAVYVYHGNFTMSNGAIRSNKSTIQGGAVYVFGSEAAAASNDSTGVFTMEGGSITDNHTVNNGGAVYVQYGAFYMSGSSSLSSNTAGGNGGAVALYYGTFTMENGKLSENTAANGGAVYVHEGNFIMSGSNTVITLNSASVNGGAVYVKGNGTVGRFEMSAGTLSGNTAAGDGGAVFVSNGNFNLSGANSQITSNYANDQGGAVYVENGDFTMSAGTLQYNGRAFEVNGETISVVQGAAITEQGGAVYVYLGNFIMSGGTIADSAVINAGGAVFVLGNGVQANRNDQLGIFSMTGGSLLRNKARNYGGAVYVDKGLFEMSGSSTVSNNHTTSSANGAGLGGAVFVQNGNFTMSDGIMSENGREFSKNGNTATAGDIITQKGGAVYVNRTESGGIFNLTGGTLSANGALNGGAVYLMGGSFNMSAGILTGNTASYDGGAVYVSDGNFTMTSGSITNNTAGANGGGFCVVGSGLTTIGVSGCYGDANLPATNERPAHTSCPVIAENNAANGGAMALVGSSLVFHCGQIIDNTATGNGGGAYVSNASITMNYAHIEKNSANIGGGIYVESSSADANVTVDSGNIISNTANYGGGIAVRVTVNGRMATIIIGRQGCDGDVNSTHKHPDISGNIATLEGGGLSLISMDANENVFDGISFVMYCGVLSGNVANQNVPTGNVLQEGGSLSISGKYEIDNATVINGTYLRPGLGNDTVVIIYHYEENGVGKTTTVTVAAPENGDLMKINLPSALPKEVNEKKMILVRWEINDDPAKSYQCGVPFTLNSKTLEGNTVVGAEGEKVLHFYAVWIYQGAGYAEAPIVSPDEVYNHVSSGLGATIVEIGNYFTVQFAVSECNPDQFNERILSFNDLLIEGTTIIMVDLTTSGTKTFYYYTFNGTEKEVSLSQFRMLGSPNVKWENNIINTNDNSVEEFLFIFDFTRTEELYSGTLQVTLTRTYKEQGEEIAPITQVGACSVVKRTMPEISVPENGYIVGDEFTVTYAPGFIAERDDSVFYSDKVALVFTANSGIIPTESYLVDESGTKYYVNRSGFIIVPLGAANVAHTKTFRLVSPYLTGSGSGINLKVSVHSTPNANSPIGSYQIDFMNLELAPKPIPSVDISLEANKLIYYVGEMPASVQLAVTTENIIEGGYELVWSVMYADVNGYVETFLITVSKSGLLTFSPDITEGIYRVVLTVKENGVEIVRDVQNIAVLESRDA